PPLQQRGRTRGAVQGGVRDGLLEDQDRAARAGLPGPREDAHPAHRADVAVDDAVASLDRGDHSADAIAENGFPRSQIMSAVAARSPTQVLRIEKVKEHIGAIVTGVDLAQPLDAATRKKLYDAAVENVVLVIRGQEHLTPGQLQAAGEIFGELMED